ncbi:MAG: quinone oxidoreductase [Pseudomonadota bacterium]|jgi:NADPH2:quinone reductase|nr:quinone oxidoreductase [Pseudomonadota bacterium]
MVKAILVHEPGGPEALRFESIEVGDPGVGEVRLRHTAVGLNFIDVYFRTGAYPAPQLPFTPGFEAAGVVEAVGDNVADVKTGDRVAYASAPIGAYAEARLMPADRVVKVPDGIEDRTAAAAMLKGMTTQYLLRQTVSVSAGDTILFHAAAGGVGLMACQWASRLGATVIGTVSSDEKAELARQHGCTHLINYTREDFVERVGEFTEGKGVDVVYDAVGKDTFLRGFDCLRPRGHMVLFGASSGAPDPIDPAVLQGKGSLYLTRPSLFNYIADRKSLLACVSDLFEVMQDGTVRAEVNQERPLAEAANAHRDLESRKTTGATVLVP